MSTLLAQRLKYPDAPRGTVVDDYHGIKVPDPYRWLENPDATESRKWITAENQITNAYLASVPNRAEIAKRLTELSSVVMYPRPGGDPSASFIQRGGRYFFLRRDSGKNQPILYWMESRTAAPKPLLDPNAMNAAGTTAVSSWRVSNDGKLLAYGVARAGSDWQDIHFRQVDTGKDLDDKLEWSKFIDPEWAADGKGIYYGQFPKPNEKEILTSANEHHKLYYHQLGLPQSQDRLVYERPDHKDWMFAPTVSDDGAYLLIAVAEGTKPQNLVFYRDLKSGSDKFIELINKFEAQYRFLGNRGPVLYFDTTASAPRGRIVSIDIAHGNKLTEIIPQSQYNLDQAALGGDSLYVVYQKDVSSELLVYGLGGKLRKDVPLPGKGQVHLPEEASKSTEQFFTFAAFTQPETLYSLDTKSWKSEPLDKEAKLPFDPSAFETRQVFYPSKDGTKISMFLVGRKGFRPDPNTPVLLYGYGGFNISLTPSYSALVLQWVELGGVFASANLRGGGEYGEDWHQAGMKDKKQNVFDDFIAAGEWLIANKYTSRAKLGIYGRSNGGLLIGAVLNQRPDLWGAAIPGVGVMDMLRFHKFTIGAAWTSDFGSPDTPHDFQVIRAYSPLQNIKQGAQYPPTMVLTSDHDDRVVPAHSFKYAAALQHAQEGPAPILIRIETAAGHGGGKPMSKQVEESADIIAFLEKALGTVPAH